MKEYLANHTFLIFLALLFFGAIVLTLAILGKPIDVRIVTVVVMLAGGLLGKAVT
jgi:hypothetical protein